MTLPRAFLDRPLAHRGFHDARQGRAENSLAAFGAAIDRGYGIELDVQISADGQPVVFHDATLDRMTRETGPVAARSAADLRRIALGDTNDRILSLDEVLDRIDGRAPVLIEIKDQPDPASGIVGAVGRILQSQPTDQPLAAMSFNPLYIIALRDLCDVPRGLTTGAADVYGDHLPRDILRHLVGIEHFDAGGCCFVSHDRTDLNAPRLAELKAKGAHILCWTITSQAEADAALRLADNITFEGFAPA